MNKKMEKNKQKQENEVIYNCNEGNLVKIEDSKWDIIADKIMESILFATPVFGGVVAGLGSHGFGMSVPLSCMIGVLFAIACITGALATLQFAECTA